MTGDAPAANGGEGTAVKNDAIGAALSALEIGVFERGADGGFSSLATPPAWLQAFSSDTSFPFLGSFLEEARQFWAEPRPSRLTWGPCAATNPDGTELHFRVSALSLPDRQFLVFELDPGAVMMREILQKAREQALERGGAAKPPPPKAADATTDPGLPRVAADNPTLAAAAADARQCASAVHDLAIRARDAGPGAAVPELVSRLAEKSGMLLALLERLIAARSR